MSECFDSALYGVCENIRSALIRISENDKAHIFEIRLREERPVALTKDNATFFLRGDGRLSLFLTNDCLFCRREDIKRSFELICDYSLQTHEEEIRNGYISMKNGHRAGIGGEGVMMGSELISFRRIGSINIRIARPVQGVCADVMRCIHNRFGTVPGCVIFGPPAAGKTTFLRDIAAYLSKSGKRCVLIDEKNELYSSGDFDIISGTDKAIAAQMAVRNLNPQYILFDEIGDLSQARQVENCFCCGVNIITTLHAGNIDELLRRNIMRIILKSQAIKVGIYLTTPYEKAEIFDLGEVYEMDGDTADIPLIGFSRYDERHIS